MPGEDIVRTRLLTLADVTGADAEAWHRLADRAAEPNVYLDPRFLLPARDRGRAAADLRLLVVEDAGDWLAALAVTTKPLAPRLPLRAATTGGSFMTGHADRHHPLLRAGQEVAALRGLLGGARRAGLPGLLQLQHLPLGGPVERALAEVAAEDGTAVLERRRQVAAFAPRADVAVPEVPEGPGPVVDPPLAWDHMATDERRNMRRGVRGSRARRVVRWSCTTSPTTRAPTTTSSRSRPPGGRATHGGAGPRSRSTRSRSAGSARSSAGSGGTRTCGWCGSRRAAARSGPGTRCAPGRPGSGSSTRTPRRTGGTAPVRSAGSRA